MILNVTDCPSTPVDTRGLLDFFISMVIGLFSGSFSKTICRRMMLWHFNPTSSAVWRSMTIVRGSTPAFRFASTGPGNLAMDWLKKAAQVSALELPWRFRKIHSFRP